MQGQDSVNTAARFPRGAAAVTGVILTKLDGDSRVARRISCGT